MDHETLLISLTTDQASTSWGFVGVVKVGDVEAYRTLGAFTSPGEALRVTQVIMATVLGELLAAAEWRGVREAIGNAPRRTDLNLGVFQKGAHRAG